MPLVYFGEKSEIFNNSQKHRGIGQEEARLRGVYFKTKCYLVSKDRDREVTLFSLHLGPN